MMEYTDFSFNGKSSQEMGLINVRVNGGLFEESFLASRKITEVKIRGNDRPYFMGIEKDPLSFDLSFAFLYPYDKEAIAKVARWLDTSYYCEFFFTGEVRQRRFFCMLESDPRLLHNGLGQGYVTITMRCDSPYGFSPEYYSIKEDFTTSDGITPVSFTFTNYGDVNLKPELWIEKQGDGDVKIENLSNSDSYFLFTGLKDRETLYVDCENEYIVSDIVDNYRWDSFQGEFIEMTRGVNYLRATGKFFLTFRYRYVLLQ
jgi:phage-related protein